MSRTAIHVPVSCAICGREWTVKPSRATQNRAITCSPTCIAELRRRNRIKACRSADRRIAICPVCGESFERKPSQLAKYATSYCSRACRAVGIRGPKPSLVTGAWVPCEQCDKKVWRTPATIRPHTYCSYGCAGRAPRSDRRRPRVAMRCAHCGRVKEVIPSLARQYRYCSWRCSAGAIQGAKRGLPGRPWPQAQRTVLTATLLRKYQHEWAGKGPAHSIRMKGSRNPAWRDGSALKPYARGFTKTLKERIATRDGQQCRGCGAPRGRGTHVVHHLDGTKHNHAPSNLVLLCRPCHGKVHAGKLVLASAASP